MKPGIYRPKLSFESNFTTIPNSWIRGTGLSVNANFLLVYLLTHEIGYNITFGQIEREIGMGETAIRSAMKQLKEAGWLETQRTVDQRGYNAGLAWILTEPKSETPTLANPALDNPALGNPAALEENLFKKKTLKELNVHFDDFWKTYPRKQGKGEARRAYERACAIAEPSVILAGASRYANDPNRVDAFTTMPATWLNQERWEDEPLPERVLSSDEKKQLEADELASRREREAKQRAEADERYRLEREEFERLRREDPIQRCEHGRVIFVCRVCAPNVVTEN